MLPLDPVEGCAPHLKFLATALLLILKMPIGSIPALFHSSNTEKLISFSRKAKQVYWLIGIIKNNCIPKPAACQNQLQRGYERRANLHL